MYSLKVYIFKSHELCQRCALHFECKGRSWLWCSQVLPDKSQIDFIHVFTLVVYVLIQKFMFLTHVSFVKVVFCILEVKHDHGLVVLRRRFMFLNHISFVKVTVFDHASWTEIMILLKSGVFCICFFFVCFCFCFCFHFISICFYILVFISNQVACEKGFKPETLAILYSSYTLYTLCACCSHSELMILQISKVVRVHYFCTIALQTPSAVLKRAWILCIVDSRERRVHSFATQVNLQF